MTISTPIRQAIRLLLDIEQNKINKYEFQLFFFDSMFY